MAAPAEPLQNSILRTAVRVTPQILTPEEKAQARANIEVDGGGDGVIIVAPVGGHFTTLTEAKADADEGEVIRVRPGTYTVTNETLSKNGVTWDFELGAVVTGTFTASSNNRAIFDDLGGAIEFAVKGRGVFAVISGTSGSNLDGESPDPGAAVRIWTNGTKASFEAQRIEVTGAGGYGGISSAFGIIQRTGKLAVKIHEGIEATSLGCCWGWQGGECAMDCPSFVAEHDAIVLGRSNNARYPLLSAIVPYVKTTSNDGSGHTIRFEGEASDGLTRISIIAGIVDGFVLVSAHTETGAGKFFLAAQEIKDQIHCWAGGETYIHTQRHEAKDGHLFGSFGGNVFYSAKKLARTGSVLTNAGNFRLHKGTIVIEGVHMGDVGAAPAIYTTGSAAYGLEGPVNLTLRNCSATSTGLTGSEGVWLGFTVTVDAAGEAGDSITLNWTEPYVGAASATYMSNGTDTAADAAANLAGQLNGVAGYYASATSNVINVITYTDTSFSTTPAATTTGDASATVSDLTAYTGRSPYGCVDLVGAGTVPVTATLENCDFRVVSGGGSNGGVVTQAGNTVTHKFCTGNAAGNALEITGGGTVTDLSPY